MTKQFATVFFLALLIAPAWAQETRGSIRGRITDPSGAIVPGVLVTATQTETNAPVSTRSNGDGEYVVPLLLPGHYTVTAVANGFKTHRREGLELRLHETLQIDVELELGATTENVKVNAETPVLDVAGTSLGQLFDSRRVSELPLIGGSPIALMYLSPGVSDIAVGANNVLSAGGLAPTSSNMSVNGTPMGTTDFTIDGIPNTQTANAGTAGAPQFYGGGVASSPPADLVLEFKMETAFDASVGHTGGAVMNVILKSGANQPHGSGYWFHQSPGWNGNNFFANMQGTPRPNFQYNRQGATFTGPLFIPRVFDGRNKLFFSFGYEGYSQITPYAFTGNVPTVAEKTGDFSALLKLGTQYQIYDPNTAAPAPGGLVMRQPLAGNVVPASRISPIAQKILPFYPAPNATGLPDGENNYAVTNRGMPEDYRTFIGRLDYNLSSKQRAYFRVSQMDRHIGPYRDNFDGPGAGENFEVHMWQFAIDDVYTLSPSMVLNVRYGYDRYPGAHSPRTLGFDSTALGFPARTLDQLTSAGAMFPQIQVAGMVNMGNEVADYNIGEVHAAYASLLKVSGTHTMKLGTDVRAYRGNQRAFGYIGGAFNFGTAYTQGPLSNSPSAPVGIGQGLASLLLGLPTAGFVERNDSQATQSNYWAFYFHDSWRVRKNLTLDLGMRFEYHGADTERYNRSVAGFDTKAQLSITQAAAAAFAARPAPAPPVGQFKPVGGLLFAGVNGTPRTLWDGSWIVAPRFGAAWQPFAKTVLRAGVGLYPVPVGVGGLDYGIQSGFNQRTQFVPTLDNGLTFLANIASPLPGGLTPASGSSLGVNTYLGQPILFYSRNLAQPYAMHWTFNVQRLLPGQVLLETGYDGTKSLKIWILPNLDGLPTQYLSRSPVRDPATINFLTGNVPNPFAGLLPGTNFNGATIAQSQLLTPFPQFGGSAGVSAPTPAFSGVTAFSSQGYSWYHSLRVQVQRRFNHGITMNMSYVWSKQMDAMTFVNAGDQLPNRGIAPIDRPQRLNLNGVVELPFGKGKPIWGSAGAIANLFVRGWAVAPIWQTVSGQPIGFGNALLTGSFSSINLPAAQRSIYQWFNTSVFNRVTAQQLANNVITFPALLAGLRSGIINQWDFAATKDTRFHERWDVQFRAEFFNAFNHPNQFAPPNTNPTASAFGVVNAINGNPRNVQIGLKLRF